MVDTDIGHAQVCAKGNGVISKSPDTWKPAFLSALERAKSIPAEPSSQSRARVRTSYRSAE